MGNYTGVNERRDLDSGLEGEAFPANALAGRRTRANDADAVTQRIEAHLGGGGRGGTLGSQRAKIDATSAGARGGAVACRRLLGTFQASLI